MVHILNNDLLSLYYIMGMKLSPVYNVVNPYVDHG